MSVLDPPFDNEEEGRESGEEEEEEEEEDYDVDCSFAMVQSTLKTEVLIHESARYSIDLQGFLV